MPPTLFRKPFKVPTPPLALIFNLIHKKQRTQTRLASLLNIIRHSRDTGKCFKLNNGRTSANHHPFFSSAGHTQLKTLLCSKIWLKIRLYGWQQLSCRDVAIVPTATIQQRRNRSFISTHTQIPIQEFINCKMTSYLHANMSVRSGICWTNQMTP